MKTNKIVFWIATGLLSVMMLFSAIGMYILNHSMAEEAFTALGFPTWIIYPLAVAKILGIAAITTRKSARIKEWAYAGFFFNFVLAASAHIAVGDNEAVPAIAALVLLIVSYIFGERMAKDAA